MYNIAILLATYNSEKYLSELLDSIFSQTYHGEWKLFISDDSSSDSTLSICELYRTRFPDKIDILENSCGDKLKSYKNFLKLLYSINANYYMFCDHDDVWISNKIEVSINAIHDIEKKHPNTPIIVHTDMKVVDKNLSLIAESFWNFSKIQPEHVKFEELVQRNCVTGCAMIFNNAAKKISFKNIEYCTMHDSLLALSVAAVKGIIHPLYIQTVLYRQHNENVIGAKNNTFIHLIKSSLKGLSNFSKRNIEIWKRTRKIRKYSLLTFYLTKVKIKCSLLTYHQNKC